MEPNIRSHKEKQTELKVLVKKLIALDDQIDILMDKRYEVDQEIKAKFHDVSTRDIEHLYENL